MKWGDYIARTAVRKVVYVVVGGIIAALLAWAAPANAQYEQCNSNSNGNMCADQGAAAAALASAWANQLQDSFWDGCSTLPPTFSFPAGASYGTATQTAQGGQCGPAGNMQKFKYYATGCPADKPYDPSTGKCGNECAGKPPLTGKSAPGDAGGFCTGGCTYVADMEKSVVLGHGTPNRRTFGTFNPTGGQCTASDESDTYDPNRGICQTVGATASGPVSQCVQPDGRICVSVGGTRLCHQPGETGDRINSDGTLATNTKLEGQTPTPPAQQVNPQHVTTTTTTVNNNTTVTGVYSGSGTRPGQSNVGTGGSDSGAGAGDGDGNGDGEGDGPGAPGGQPGRFYEGNGKGIAEAYSAFATRAQQAPLLAAAGNILGGCSGGGSCPVDTWDGGDYAGNHSLAEWCSGPLAGLLSYAGYILLAGMGAVAIRIGLL